MCNVMHSELSRERYFPSDFGESHEHANQLKAQPLS